LDWFFLKSLYLCYEKDACSFYTITGIEDKSSEENLKMVQELIRLKKEFDEQKE
jgi:3-phenylpropionate/cinnamic acid dioxygenase small subunit